MNPERPLTEHPAMLTALYLALFCPSLALTALLVGEHPLFFFKALPGALFKYEQANTIYFDFPYGLHPYVFFVFPLIGVMLIILLGRLVWRWRHKCPPAVSLSRSFVTLLLVAAVFLGCFQLTGQAIFTKRYLPLFLSVPPDRRPDLLVPYLTAFARFCRHKLPGLHHGRIHNRVTKDSNNNLQNYFHHMLRYYLFPLDARTKLTGDDFIVVFMDREYFKNIPDQYEIFYFDQQSGIAVKQ